MEPSPRALRDRVLLVLYDMTDGKDGVSVPTADLLRRCEEAGVHTLTDEEWRTYTLAVGARVAKLRAQAS